MWNDFKKFAFKGNIVDLAVAVIIGGAFGKIVTSLVNDMLMPVIGIFLGGIDFTSLTFRFGKAVIKYGTFIQTVVNFFIIALTLFMVVRFFLKFKKEEQTEPASPTLTKQETLLTEIRDILKSSLHTDTDTHSGPKLTIKKQD